MTSGAWLIDDSYNANPSSVRAGIEVLASIDGRKWLVLGDMAELGEFAESSHTEMGTFAREHGIERAAFDCTGFVDAASWSFRAPKTAPMLPPRAAPVTFLPLIPDLSPADLPGTASLA